MIRNLLPCAAALFAASATAAPLVWNVSGAFTDGGTISGSFTFDAAATSVPVWNIHVAGGDTATFPAFDYVTNPVGVYYNAFLDPEIAFAFYDPNSTRRLVLLTQAPLTDAGGTVGLVGFISASESSVECYNCNPFRVLADGGFLSAIATDGAAAPEPASLGMLLAGGAVLAGARWQKIRWRE